MSVTKQFKIRSRTINGAVYIRKEDLLDWLEDEAKGLREQAFSLSASQTESIASAIRMVWPSDSK